MEDKKETEETKTPEDKGATKGEDEEKIDNNDHSISGKPLKFETEEKIQEEKKKFPACLFYILMGLMVITGTANQVITKNLMKLYSKGIQFEQHHFFMTFGMFLGELISIFPYTYIYFKNIKKKKEEPLIVVEEVNEDNEGNAENDIKANSEKEKKLPPIKSNFLFALSALCDLIASTLYTFALTYLTASMYQMLRAFELFFVCIFSKIFLKAQIYRHQYLGVGILIIGLVLCAVNSIIKAKDDEENARDPKIGIPVEFVSMIFVGSQYTLQELFLKKYTIHPLQLVGFEGLFGSIIYSIILIISQYIDCKKNFDEDIAKDLCFIRPDGKSRLEDTDFAFQQLGASAAVCILFIGYIISIAIYNLVGIALAQIASSTARAIIDTSRTVFIWIFFLAIHPVKGTKENFYVLQLVGFILLLAGNLVYNEIIPLKFWNLDYYYRVNIAKRKKEEEDLSRQSETSLVPGIRNTGMNSEQTSTL